MMITNTKKSSSKKEERKHETIRQSLALQKKNNHRIKWKYIASNLLMKISFSTSFIQLIRRYSMEGSPPFDRPSKAKENCKKIVE